jgi:hypothetical protein
VTPEIVGVLSAIVFIGAPLVWLAWFLWKAIQHRRRMKQIEALGEWRKWIEP